MSSPTGPPTHVIPPESNRLSCLLLLLKEQPVGQPHLHPPGVCWQCIISAQARTHRIRNPRGAPTGPRTPHSMLQPLPHQPPSPQMALTPAPPPSQMALSPLDSIPSLAFWSPSSLESPPTSLGHLVCLYLLHSPSLQGTGLSPVSSLSLSCLRWPFFRKCFLECSCFTVSC